ncbi:MAG TPA: hypothetical protein VNG31_02970, partial [Candidatus Baltobacteraceae bacterium]|nr:hypothetical protein [Candidatus Baltobacteraceae bacterium]
VVAALAERGIGVEPVVWDADRLPAGLDALVVRSPWNYHLDPDAFLRWIDRAAGEVRVFNDSATIRWNAHKGYLFEIEAAGIAVAPTVLCPRHEPSNLRAIMDARAWKSVIVKPAISAGSFMTAIVGDVQAVASHAAAFEGRFVGNGQPLLDRILESRDALVQPFIPEIFTRGERCMMFFDGEYSHCVQKEPFTDAPGGGSTVDADAHEIEIGRRALRQSPSRSLYARVDLLRDAGNVERLMELELIDPELYLRADPKAADRFAGAIEARL